MAETVRGAYERWHRDLPVDADLATPWHRMVMSHLDAEAFLHGKRVLEVGCGRGAFSCWLASHQRRPARVVGADIALTAVAKGASHARGSGADGPSWLAADIQGLPFADGSFDTVFSCETIEHVPRPRLALAELARVLEPGGRLFLTTPNYLNVWAIYRAFLRVSGRRFTEAGQPLNRLMLLPREVWRVKRLGLRVRRVDGVTHYFPRGRGKPAVELSGLERWRFLTRWIATQTMILAEKPCR